MISLICREMFSYSKVQEEVLRLLTSSIEFAKTQDFITYIMNEGCDMQKAVEQLNTRKTDLMTECAIVIAGKSIYVSRSWHSRLEHLPRLPQVWCLNSTAIYLSV